MNTTPSPTVKATTFKATCPNGHTHRLNPGTDLSLRPIRNCSCGHCKPDAIEVVYRCKTCGDLVAVLTDTMV